MNDEKPKEAHSLEERKCEDCHKDGHHNCCPSIPICELKNALAQQKAKAIEMLVNNKSTLEKLAELIYAQSPILRKPYSGIGEQMKEMTYRPFARIILEELKRRLEEL